MSSKSTDFDGKSNSPSNASKSLLDLDGLPAKDPSLSLPLSIYSKILAALLLDDLTQAFISFSPWGFDIQ